MLTLLKSAPLLLIVIIFYSINGKAQIINPGIFGQNAWMPDVIGDKIYNGKLHSKWEEVKQSGAMVIRFGGIAPDRDMPTKEQFLKVIDSVRIKGMEPIIQVPFYNYKYTASQAADIVNYINIEKKRNIKFWSIGNEPDNSYGYTFAEEVANYYKSFSSAMKAIDPSIKIIGPETSWYAESIIHPLTDPGSPYDLTGKNSSGRYYIDVLSFHTYPFNDLNKSRDAVITSLTESGKFLDRLKDANSRIKHCNEIHGRVGSEALEVAVTEANVVYLNASNDNLYGVGANSFVGGQFWAEMMGICMSQKVDFLNFWSIIEGNQIANSLGYLDHDTGKRKPTYYHFQMIAKYFKGSYCSGETNQYPYIKAFGSKDINHIGVVILNQHESDDFNYTLKLKSDPISGSSGLKISIDANTDKEYAGFISRQSTILLLFDLSGKLKQKCEYSLAGNASFDKSPDCINYCEEAIAAITPAGSMILCNDKDSILLTASETSCYSYQWKKNGQNIVGANEFSYIVKTPGIYAVEVSNGQQTAISDITANVSQLMALISASGPTAFCEGGSVILSSNTGTGYSYQWFKDEKIISGATESSYKANITGEYKVEIISGTCKSISNTIQVIASCEEQLIALNGVWKYLDNGSNQNIAWRTVDFNDSGWPSGNAELGYGDGDEATVIRYGSDARNKYITYYFRKSIHVIDAASFKNLELQFLRDDGAVVYLNGMEVIRSNMPSGNIISATLASSSVSSRDEKKIYSTTVNPSLLINGKNVIAVEVHQDSKRSSDISFNLSLKGMRNVGNTCSSPSELTAVSNTTTSAILQWNSVSSAMVYTLEYRQEGSSSWISIKTPNNSIEITDLLPGTTYESRVQTECKETSSGFSSLYTFKTLNSFPDAEEIIPLNSTWKYMDNGSNQNTAWRAIDFNDSGWRSGNTELGYGDGDEATIISYGSDANNKYITCYFRKSFNLFDPTSFTGLELQLLRDDGAVVYLNGAEVFRSNMPSGSITYTTLASSAVSGSDEKKFYSIPVNPSLLLPGKNVVAVEAHQSSKSSSDVSFNFRLKGTNGSQSSNSSQQGMPLSLEEAIPDNSSALEFIPNPSTGLVNIIYDSSIQDDLLYRVTHISGQVVLEGTHPNFTGIFSKSFDLSGKAKGIYLLEILHGTKKITKKLILE